MKKSPRGLWAGVALLGLAFGARGAEQPVDFAREILPILSDKCFVCHGPDSNKKQDLRLDSREAATADRGGVRPIHPERLADSELIARIFDTEDPMPPEDAEQHLSVAERELLKKWVLEGAVYAAHWAFVPPVRAAAPTGAAGHPIDAFVAHRLKGAKVDFAPEADRRT